MDDEVFNTVLTRLRPYSPEWVATAHCGESLLHPQFADRVAALSAAGHPLLLMTNGTRLTEKLTEFLLGMDVFGASFNFPSLIPSQWASFMCLPQHLFERTRKAIEGFISLFGHRVRELNIIVNAISEDQEARAEAIRAHFNVFGPVRVIATPSNSRAGAIDNPEVVSVKHTAADTFAGWTMWPASCTSHGPARYAFAATTITSRSSWETL